MKKVLLISVTALLPLVAYAPWPSAQGIAHAEGLPDLGDVSASDLSPQMEKRIGEEAMNEIRQNEPTYLADPEVASYLGRLAGRLSAQLEGEGQSQYFEVFALKDSSLNAFAMPGGYIGVHSGLILAAQSESELAGVMAHEISHVTQHHLARSIAPQKNSQMAAMLAFAVALLAARSRPDLAQGAIIGSQAAAIQNQLSYSRDFEREADRMGIQLLEKAGFDVRGMGTFFERLDKNSRLYNNNTPGYLRTHPLTTERITDMENRIQIRPYRQVLDSTGFQLVRAKLRAQDGSAQDAITDFNAILNDRKYVSEAATRYGLARAYIRANKLPLAVAEVATLRKLKLQSSMMETLAAEVQQKTGDLDGALRTLRAARKTYSHERAITYNLAELLLVMGKPQDVIQLASEELQNYTTDANLYRFLARGYAATGQPFREHRAQAEAYVREGRLAAAIEQLQISQKARDGDFYEHSQVDARLRALRTKLIEDERQRRSQ